MHPKFTIEPCQVCGTPFRLKAYVAADPQRGKFCSPPCYWKHRTTLRRPMADRLWPKVDQSGGPAACWPHHEKGRRPKGYGTIGTGGRNGQDIAASRAAWIVTYGPIADGLYVLHTCDNPPCCNPAHLFLGTPSDNMADKVNKGRQTRGEQIKSAKLTEAQAREILVKFATGTVKQTELGREYGVSNITISDLVRRKTWRHLS